MIKNPSNFILILILIVCAFCITLYSQWPGLAEQYTVHDDVTQYIPAVYAIRDQIPAENDLILQYMIIKNSPGHLWLFVLLSYIAEPLLLVKILPFILCIGSVLLLFYYGKLLKNETVGYFSALLFSFYIWTSEYGFFSGALPKSFAFPLLIAFLCFLLNKQYLSCFIILILQIIFYPIVTIVSLIILFLSVLFDKTRTRNNILWLIVIFIVSAATTFILYRAPNDLLGSMVTFKEMIKMPEFCIGGRDELFVPGIMNFLRSEDMSGIAISRMFILLLGGCLGSLIILGKEIRCLPKHLIYTFCATIIGFVLSYAFLFELFFPGRYVEFTLPICMILLIAFAIEKLISLVKPRIYAKYILAIMTIIIIVICSPYLKRDFTNYERSFYGFLGTIPNNVRLAGHPYDMDPIPLFAKKRVLIQYEASTAWYKSYYKETKKRTHDFFRAYYSHSISEIMIFMKENKVDYLLVNREHFTKDYLIKSDYYIEPFNNFIKKQVNVNKDDFALISEEIHKYVVFDDGEKYFIIKKM